MKISRIRALLVTAYADGFFDSRELFIINERAKDLGLSGEDILKLIRNPEPELVIYPVTVEERIHFLYDLMCVILADGKVDDSEKQIFYKYLKEFNFDSTLYNDLYSSMMNSVKEHEDLETYFKKYFEDEI
ncbi:TerB family tellurite resistance protein [Ulvibacter sp. MAR_2010_11]|uniref:tellurite resistance TerB family protein n=1 Tax=Ulvibacter sp. MAR_2010_11 TaxID=1250229 RepID=UPI000C2B7829|nr:TerB family tellurite resistance protein [Ulvibacter sp. MAR_2010_11]